MTLLEGSINGDRLRTVLQAATVLAEECRVFLEQDTLKIRGTDPGGVSVVIIEISQGAFIESEIGTGDVCWDFEEMTDMIKMADQDSGVNLQIEEHNLIIDFLDLHFTLTLLDPASLANDSEKPDMEFDSIIAMDSSVFERGIKAADLVADHVEFGIDEDESAFYMEAKGDVNEVILKRKKQDLVTLSAKSASSTYSVDYLKDICTAVPDDTVVDIAFGTDLPSEISFSIADGDTTVTYFIAPRLQPDH